MPWVNPSTRATGYLVTAANWNQDVVANTEYLARPPSVSVRKSTTQAMTNNVWRSIAWNSEAWDTDSMWSSTAASRIDINTAGKYLVTAAVAWNVSTASTVGTQGRLVGVRVGGSSTAAPNRAQVQTRPTGSTGVRQHQSVSDIIALTSTQFVRLQVFQDSGANLSVTGSSADQTLLSVLWVSS